MLGQVDNRKLSPAQFKAINDMKKFAKFRTALIEILKPYINTGASQESGGPSKGPSTPKGKGKGGKSGAG